MDYAKRGKLFVVATPIGNLEDISPRALRTLDEVDLILSEDTRETNKILKKFDISTPQTAYTDQKHTRVIDQVLLRLENGENLALVSDNGTPVISDPGFNLISDLRSKSYDITAVPGPSAATTALSVSGLPTDNYIFLGFLPKKDGKRKALISQYGNLEATLVLYESPHRLKKLLFELHETLGERVLCIAKDLTKKFESISTLNLSEAIELPEQTKGEFVVLVAKEGYKIDGR